MRRDQRIRASLALSGLTLMLALAGCGVTPTPSAAATPSNDNPRLSEQARRYLPAGRAELAAIVRLKAGESVTALEQRLGGVVEDLESEAGFAVMGFSRAAYLALQDRRADGEIDAINSNQGSVSLPELIADSGGPHAWLMGKGLVAWSGGKGGLPAWSGGKGGLPAWSGGVGEWSGGSIAWTSGKGGLPAWSGGKGGLPAWSGGDATVEGNTHTWEQVKLAGGWANAPKLGNGVTVAVIDTGVDLSHPAFGDPHLTFTPPNTWRDYVDHDNVPQDIAWPDGTRGPGFGHGTGVAGTLLQVAPRVKLLPLRVLNPDGSGDVTDVAAAIGYAVRQGVQIINLSLGAAESSVLDRMVKYAASRGVYVVTSAGNSGDQNVTYPARDGNLPGATGALTLAVGSVDRDDVLSVFSSFGPSLDLVAPGEFVWTPAPGSLQAYWSGTSFSAPMSAGALALGIAQNPWLARFGQDAKLLAGTTDNVDGLNAAKAGQFGRGRLNIEKFVKAVNNSDLSSIWN